ESVPIDLETICLRAMEKEPARRYRTAGEMAADLRRYADNHPIASRRATIFERGMKWIRRHPALTAIYALSLIVLAGASLWTTQIIRTRHARADELVRQSYEMLAIDDYRESAAALSKLKDAQRLGPDDWNYRRAVGFARMGTEPATAIETLSQVSRERPDDTE